MTNTTHPRPLFSPGQVFLTPQAEAALNVADQSPFELIARHLTADWGELPPEDVAENQRALEHDLPIRSRYLTKQNVVIWVITEFDRSCTTLLTPNEY